ncbi:MAG: response regulator transcription factor [Actinobacteria bacterium]|nr:response regulator transcription factor [Actinomycetota bacterium]
MGLQTGGHAMQLLCLTGSDPAAALPGLDLLPHEVHRSPLDVRLTASAAARFDVLLIDGTLDIRGARTACLELAGDCPVPRVLLCSETMLAVVAPEWQIADVMLPTASPAEIELRLKLAAAGAVSGLTANSPVPAAVSVAGVVIDEGNFTARVHDRILDLTYKEFELLHFLTSNSGRVFTREQLLSEVWGMDYYGGTRTVDVHVRRLRAKLGEQEGLIGTVRGVGYGFARSPEESSER